MNEKSIERIFLEMVNTNKEKNIKSNKEDYKAIKEIIAGNPSSFDFIQKKYKPLLSIMIRRMVRNEDDVQDLVQDTFIKAYNALDKFKFGYSFSAWIYRIASNTCIDFLRKKRFQFISIDRPNFTDDEDYVLEIEDRNHMPDLEVIQNDKQLAINEAMEQLPENFRKIIQLRHEQELDYQEIARILDIPLGTVKAHLFRARKMMYNSLRDKLSLFRDD